MAIDARRQRLGLDELSEFEDEEDLGRAVLQLLGSLDTTADVTRIERKKLNRQIMVFVERYHQIGKRDPFFWKWACEAVDLVTLSCVDPNWREYLLTTKILGIMLLVVLDDVADQDQDQELLDLLIRAIQNEDDQGNLQSEALSRKYYFIRELWSTVRERAARMPRYSEFAPLLDFDYAQLFNCCKYTLMVNIKPSLLNLLEHNLYHPHSMHITIANTFDLMCSPGFESSEHGILREVAWNVQMMARIGNSIATWQREINEMDYSSDVFPLALDRGIIHSSELLSSNTTELKRKLLASDVEILLLAAWAKRRRRVIELSRLVHSVDLSGLIRAHQELLRLNLSSRGHI